MNLNNGDEEKPECRVNRLIGALDHSMGSMGLWKKELEVVLEEKKSLENEMKDNKITILTLQLKVAQLEESLRVSREENGKLQTKMDSVRRTVHIVYLTFDLYS